MEYSRIVAVTGLPGLYEIVSSKSDGAIVRSLEDGNTKFVSSRVHNLSHLESIEIYTTGENTTLADVFNAIKGSAEARPDVKDGKALKSYFEKTYPQLDFDRVYASDMKKMVNWYSVLEKHTIDFSAKAEEEEAVEDEAKAEENTPESVEATEPAAEAASAKTTKTRKKKTEE